MHENATTSLPELRQFALYEPFSAAFSDVPRAQPQLHDCRAAVRFRYWASQSSPLTAASQSFEWSQGDEWKRDRFPITAGAIALAEELRFSRAAQRRNITQPALTKQIADLEDKLGVLLFLRDRQTVELTDACRAFIEDARLAVMHLERAIQRAKAVPLGAEVVLSIGRSPYTDPYLISTIASIRLPLYPTLKIEIESNFSGELAREVVTGRLDLAILTEGAPTPQLSALDLEVSPFYILFRRDEELTRLKTVRFQDLNAKVWVMFGRHVHLDLYDKVMRSAGAHGVSPLTVHHATTAEEAAQLVSQVGGVAFLTRNGAWRVLDQGLTMRPLQEEGLDIKTVLVARNDTDSRVIGEFIRTLANKLKRNKPPKHNSLPLSA